MELWGIVTARFAHAETPNWRPLEQVLAADLLGRFMWMAEFHTPGGGSIQCYKHIDTMRSIHLDANETAFAYLGDDRYGRVSLPALLEEVFEPWGRLGASPERWRQPPTRSRIPVLTIG
jgi:hypothetical protein